MPKVSIIIPVYNTEKFLRECLDSVINQTLKDIEIICINDGSTDNSLDILNEYAQKDKRIIVINQENKGQGSARNKGISIAKSNYIYFVDSDDWIDLSCVEKLYNKIIECKSDICLMGYYKYFQDTKELTLDEWFDASKYEINKEFFFSRYESCLKMYKTSYIKNNNIQFPIGIYYEDVLFSIKTFLLTKEICILPENLYFYRIVKSSTMGLSKSSLKVLDILYIIEETEIFLKDTCLYEEFKDIFWNFALDQILYHLNRITDKKIEKTYKKEIKKYLNNKSFKPFSEKIKRKYANICNSYLSKFIKSIFSIKNHQDKKHKIVTVLGVQFRIKRNNSEKIQNNYKRILKRLKIKIKNNNKIKVLFLVNDISKWKTESLYRAMENHDLFEPAIALTVADIQVNYSEEDKKNILIENYNYFKKENYNVIYAYNIENNLPIDLNTLDADIIFYQQPYNLYNNQNVEHTSKHALTCYVPYYIANYENYELDCSYKFHKNLFRFYVLNKELEKNYKNYLNKHKAYNKNILTVGHTILDNYEELKKQYKNKDYVIYAPHWSICSPKNLNNINISTFLETGDMILEYAKKHSTLNWVFKPHPTLKTALERIGWSKCKIENYYSEWEKFAKCCYDSSYKKLFFESKVLITDCGSFLQEYFYTGKPLIHLISKNCKNMPYKFLREIMDTFYNVENFESLTEILDDILLKNNDSKIGSRKKIIDKTAVLQNNTAQNIIRELLNTLKVGV